MTNLEKIDVQNKTIFSKIIKKEKVKALDILYAEE